jgi:hypothetical protein
MSRPAFITRALVLAAMALAPLLAMTTGAGIQPHFTARDEAPMDAEETTVAVDNPQAVFTIGSPAEQLAIQIAKTTWNANPCGGAVTVEWGTLGPDINAQSSWSNPTSAYDNPEQNGDCTVTFNPGADFDWKKFCTVMVHEYGHLAGNPHSPDPNDVMAAYYTKPLQTCVDQTPSQFAPAPAPAAQPAASLARVRTTPKAAKKKTAKKHRVVKQTKKKSHKKAKRHRRAKKHHRSTTRKRSSR